MRISEKVVRIGLILMVALSIYFSYAIWLSPAGKSSINVDETNTQMIESQSNRKKLPKSFFRFMLHGTIRE